MMIVLLVHQTSNWDPLKRVPDRRLQTVSSKLSAIPSSTPTSQSTPLHIHAHLSLSALLVYFHWISYAPLNPQMPIY